MNCNQCEQTVQGKGCTLVGVCGKQPDVAALQDLLAYSMRGLSVVALEARAVSIVDSEIDHFVAKAHFSTLTNVNFDPEYFADMVRKGVAYREELKGKVAQAGGAAKYDDPAANYTPGADIAGLVEDGEKYGMPINRDADADIQSLQEVTLYGIRGVAAYADHAAVLGKEDPAVYGYIHSAVAKMADTSLDLNDWVGIALECGKTNLRAMEILDDGNTSAYGHPEPSEVNLGQKAGKAILISGHDLKDLKELLEQTEGTGVNIYTHGEMLPAHGYPELKKYDHLVGNYGTAWQNQKKEFEAFPGAILMTTNCLMPPTDSYKDKVFTTGNVGFPGLSYITNGDFASVIAKAQELDGFAADVEVDTVLTGFARNAVLGVADKVIAGVKAGDIKHFFLVGGCDGAKPGRNYFTEFVEKAPADTIVMTLACGKYRFFDKKLGDIGGIPRLLDIGQCNDAYSAVQIAVALADAFECGVNDLPLSFILSWYEQKAVAILLSLLSLGIKNIRLGPSLPVFITPNVLGVLVENFDLKPVAATAAEDLNTILGAGTVDTDIVAA